MANLDSRSKRASSVGILLVSVLAPPLPDGSLAAAGDRQHIAWSYSGVSAAAPDIDGPPVYLRGATMVSRTLRGSTMPFRVTRGSTKTSFTLRGEM